MCTAGLEVTLRLFQLSLRPQSPFVLRESYLSYDLTSPTCNVPVHALISETSALAASMALWLRCLIVRALPQQRDGSWGRGLAGMKRVCRNGTRELFTLRGKWCTRKIMQLQSIVLPLGEFQVATLHILAGS